MNNKQPIGAYANIRWLDTNEEVDGYYFSFGEYDDENDADCDSFGVSDESIFFYADEEQVAILQKAIAENRDCVTIEPHSGWYIDLTEPYEFIYEVAYQDNIAHMTITKDEIKKVY
jgi:hypothetical protein